MTNLTYEDSLALASMLASKRWHWFGIEVVTVAIQETGGNLEESACLLGTPYPDVYRWCQEWPELRARLDEVRGAGQ